MLVVNLLVGNTVNKFVVSSLGGKLPLDTTPEAMHQRSRSRRRLVQDGTVEGRALTPSRESTGITTNC